MPNKPPVVYANIVDAKHFITLYFYHFLPRRLANQDKWKMGRLLDLGMYQTMYVCMYV